MFYIQNGEMVVESLKIITRDNSIRIADYAFKFAVRNNRKKITAVHKANIMLAVINSIDKHLKTIDINKKIYL